MSGILARALLLWCIVGIPVKTATWTGGLIGYRFSFSFGLDVTASQEKTDATFNELEATSWMY